MAQTADPRIPLPALSGELARRYGVEVTYKQLYGAAVNGSPLIERDPISGRYSARNSRLAEIAAAFSPARSEIAA